ncbi:FAD-binding oxidoreductase [Herbaspirillum sp. RV1423]|uniref:NAD(P)/FAD-dependent oxidoreductase n=1 Tax=Herbaspirillum sp. RV1423 TaxID=1443993 RepID=UPI0004B49BC7|nr:FAD-binding oxidoreductase [Herbaspirillum sp. RV1423]
MGPHVEHVPSDVKLPSAIDVAIVGGGIIGVCTALYLQKKGLSVAVFEKGQVAAEQSSRNWGWVRVTRRDIRELPLSIESATLWRSLKEEFDVDTGYVQSGLLYMTSDESVLDNYHAWLKKARDAAGDSFDTREVGPAEISNLLPGSKVSFRGGLYTPGDGRAEPQKAAPALARAFQKLGGKVFAPCAVRGIETTAGRVSAVLTEHGSIACKNVVVAGGAWSRLFLGSIGVELPQLLVKGSVLRTEPIEGGPVIGASNKQFAFRKREDGGYTIASGFRTYADITPDAFRLFFKYIEALKSQRGALRITLGKRSWDELIRPRKWKLDRPSPFEKMRILDPEPVEKSIATGLRKFIETFPHLSHLRVAQQWAGYMDVTPDAIPVISEIDRIPGLFVSTGYSGHGFGIGPAAGALMADLVTNDRPSVDPAPFRFGRFTDGSRIVVDAGF